MRGNKILFRLLEALFYMACPVFGFLSWEFFQMENWIMTYIASGLSFIAPLAGIGAIKMQ